VAIRLDSTNGPISGGFSISWTHQINQNANCIIVAQLCTTFGPGVPTVGGITMNTLAVVKLGDTFSSQFIGLYGLMNPPTGLQGVGMGNSSFAGFGTSAVSVSYYGVKGFGPVVTSNGSERCDLTVSSKPGDRVISMMGAYDNFTSFTGTNTTTGGNIAIPRIKSGGFLYGEAHGGTTVNLTALAPMTVRYPMTASIGSSLLAAEPSTNSVGAPIQNSFLSMWPF
jgi:hypothetical protein